MISKIAMNFAMVLLFSIAGIMLVPAALGYQRYVILTESMTGTYDRGSIVYDKPVPTSKLKVGDPITYAPPPGASPNHKLVTHRIFRIGTNSDGRRVYRTKGDHNTHPDAWNFMLPQATQDTVRFHVPYMGYVFELLSVPSFRKLAIGIPALLVAIWTIAGMWKDAGEVKNRRDEGVAPWGADVAGTLPQIFALGDGDPAAGRGIVHVTESWPAPASGRRAGPGASTQPKPLPRMRQADRTAVRRRRVALPERLVVRSGRRRVEPVPLPAGWRLEIGSQTR